MIERQWQKSVFSEPNGGSCVEIDLSRADQDEIAVRDTKLGEDSPILFYTRAEWDAHLLAVKVGQYDIGGTGKVAAIASAIGLLSDSEMVELGAAIRARTLELLAN